MTLGGLAVAVGRVVDDAIVVLENIYRHRALGEDRLTASINGPKEVAGAITAATDHHGRRVPAARLRRRPRQPVLPALRAHRHLRAARLAGLRADGRAGARLPAHQQGQGQRRRGRRAQELVLDPAPTPRRSRSPCAAAGRSSASSASSIALFFATAADRPAPADRSSSTRAPRRSSRSRSRRRPAPRSQAVLERAIEAETILLTDPKVELVQTSHPGRGRGRASRRSSPRSSGRPANSARMTVRLARRRRPRRRTPSPPRGRARAGQDRRLRRRGRPGRRASPRTASTSSSRATTPADGPAGQRRRPRGARGQRRPAQPQVRPVARARPEIQVTPDPNKSILVGLTAAQVAQEVRGALVGTTATRVQLLDEDGTTAIFVRLDPDQVTSVEDLRDAARRHRRSRSRWARSRPSSRSTPRARSPASTSSPAASITRRDRRRQHGRGEHGRPGRDRRPRRRRPDPVGVDVRLAGVTQQQNEAFGGLFISMGVAILVVYVAMVLTFNSLITPFIILFTPPARDDRRLPGAVPDRPAARRQRPHRVPDADRDRGHQRDRAARPRRTAATRGDVDLRRPDRGRADPRPADPDDGDRDDPRAGPARRGLQPGLDHRGGARHGRHRRPVQLDVPDAARHPGGLLAGRRGRSRPAASRRFAPPEPATPSRPRRPPADRARHGRPAPPVALSRPGAARPVAP